MKRQKPMIFVLIALFLLAACSTEPSTGVTPTSTIPVGETMNDDQETEMNNTDVSSGESGSSDMMADSSEMSTNHSEMESGADMAEPGMDESAPMSSESETDLQETTDERPEWQLLPLTDVRDGTTFTLSDFAGKTLFVEPMATWCTNCRMQLLNVQQARAQLNSDQVVFLGISVETNLDPASLTQYAQDFGFDWAFAVATPELLQSLVAEFGRAVINPPATPHFIIQPDGTFGQLVTGIEPADQLLSQLQG